MQIKNYLIATAYAAISSLILCLVLALFVAIGWVVVWALFTMIFIPIVYKAIQFYKDHDCADISEFFEELLEEQSRGSIIEQ